MSALPYLRACCRVMHFRIGRILKLLEHVCPFCLSYDLVCLAYSPSHTLQRIFLFKRRRFQLDWWSKFSDIIIVWNLLIRQLYACAWYDHGMVIALLQTGLLSVLSVCLNDFPAVSLSVHPCKNCFIDSARRTCFATLRAQSVSKAWQRARLC